MASNKYTLILESNRPSAYSYRYVLREKLKEDPRYTKVIISSPSHKFLQRYLGKLKSRGHTGNFIIQDMHKRRIISYWSITAKEDN